MLVSKELHADGHAHLHALLKWDKKFDTRNERYFDIDSFHPNVQACKSIVKTSQYIKKDGDWMEKGEVNTSNYDLARGMSEEEWVDHCITTKISYSFCMHVWKKVSMVNTLTTFVAEDGWISEPLKSMTWDMLYTGKVLHLKGDTGIGKSTWAMLHAPKPCLVINHADALKQFRIGYHKSIILDEMSFKHWPRETQIAIADMSMDRQIHVRYGFAQIPKNTPKIFTSNVEIFMEDEAIQRRVDKRVFVRPFQ